LSFTVTVPTAVPWTIEGAAWVISPYLFNGDVNNWAYYNQIGYSNTTGTPENPEVYRLGITAGVVNSETTTYASPTSKFYHISLFPLLKGGERRENSNEAARDQWRAPMLTRCATG
jgi:hypothetical protein